MNYKLLSYLLIIILAVNILFTANMYFKNSRVLYALQEQNALKKEQTTESLRHGMLVELLMDNIKMYYRYENKMINDFDILNIKGEKMRFSSLLDESYRIIFKFSSKNCSSCIDAELKVIMKIADQIDPEKIIILSDGQGMRQLVAFIRERNLKIPIYRISQGSEISILEQENVPFVCLMNESLRTELLFIPIKELNGFSEQYYYNTIIPRFINK